MLILFCVPHCEVGTEAEKTIFYNQFCVLCEVGSVAEETVEYQPLSVVNVLHDISIL